MNYPIDYNYLRIELFEIMRGGRIQKIIYTTAGERHPVPAKAGNNFFVDMARDAYKSCMHAHNPLQMLQSRIFELSICLSAHYLMAELLSTAVHTRIMHLKLHYLPDAYYAIPVLFYCEFCMYIHRMYVVDTMNEPKPQ